MRLRISGRWIAFAMLASLGLGMAFAAPSVVLSNLKGKVEVKPLNATAWIPATDGMKINTLTTVSTGFDSSVTITMDKNTVFVKPLTRMTVDKIVEEQGKLKTSCYLRVGTVQASVKSAEGVKQEFQVQSPYSTASVRGTEFEYDGLNLRVSQGLVAFIPGRPTRDIQLPPAESETEAEEEPKKDGEPLPGAGEAFGEAIAKAEEGAPEGEPAAEGEKPAEPAADGEKPLPPAGEPKPVPPPVGEPKPMPSLPDFAKDFVGAPPPSAAPMQAIFIPAGQAAEVRIQTSGGIGGRTSGDREALKADTTVATSGSSVVSETQAPVVVPVSKYGKVTITVTVKQ